MPKEEMIKTVNQQIIISQGIQDLMSKFRNMVNDCIRIGIQNNVTSLKTLSTKSYRYLDRYYCKLLQASCYFKSIWNITK